MKRVIKQFGGVWTNGDKEDIGNGDLLRSRNMRPELGLIKKTYGAGVITDDGAVCPVTVATGYSVINIFCFINENLPDGREYIALIQKDSTLQVWVYRFDSDYNLASGEPSILLPFGSDSFWLISSSIDFNSYGRVPLTNISVTDSDAVTYTFDKTFSAHRPQPTTNIYGNKTVWAGVPSDLGQPFYSSGDAQKNVFNDTVAFDNGIIKTFLNTDGDIAIPRFAYVNNVMFALVQAKAPSSSSDDKLYFYDSGSWQLIAKTDYEPLFDSASDYIQILHIVKKNDELVMVYMFFDASAATNKYIYKSARLSDILGSDTWTNDWTNAKAAPVHISSGFNNQDSTTSFDLDATKTTFYISETVTGVDNPGGMIVTVEDGQSAVESAVPTGLSSSNRSGVGIALADSNIFLYVNNTSGTLLEAYSASSLPVSPTWSTVTLPSTVTGLEEGSGFVWKGAEFVVTSTDNSGLLDERLALVAQLFDGADTYFALVEFNSAAESYTGTTNYYYITSGWTIHSLYASLEVNRTGVSYISSVFDTGLNLYRTIKIDQDFDYDVLISPSSILEGLGLISYEIEHDHISSISFLFGSDDGGSSNPEIKRIVSFGANPAWASYPSGFKYEAQFGACMGWRELFQTLDIDLEFVLYQKADKNPHFIDKSTLRILGGAGNANSIETVSKITINNGGANYLEGSLVFSGGGGSGAVAVFEVSAGIIDTVIISDRGSGYTSNPTVVYDPLKSLNWLLTSRGTHLYSGDNYVRITKVGDFYIVAGTSHIQSYSFDGTSLTLEDTIALGSCYDVTTDGTFIFASTTALGGRIYAYSIDGSGVMAYIDHETALGGKAIWCDGTYIYSASASAMSSFSFNGSVFALKSAKTTGGSGGEGTAIWGDGTYIYSLSRAGGVGLSAFPVTAGVLGTKISDYSGLGFADTGYDVWGDGTNIYVANDADGLRAVSFNGSTFADVGHIDDGGGYKGVYYYNGHIYCATGNHTGLRTYVINSGVLSNAQGVQDAHSSGYGVYADADVVLYAVQSTGLTAFTFADTGVAAFTASLTQATPTDLWIGWLDREYMYDRLFQPTAGWWVNQRAPVKDSSLDIFGMFGAIGGATGKYQHIRHSLVFDGVQESLLSSVTTVYTSDERDAAYVNYSFDTAFYNGRLNRRITGIKFYEMASVEDDAAATLIHEVSFLRDISDSSLKGSYGYSGHLEPIITNVTDSDPSVNFLNQYLDTGTVTPRPQITGVTVYSTGKIALELDAICDDRFNEAWSIHDDPLAGALIESGSSGCYAGQDVLSDPTKTFTYLGLEGLMAAVTPGGTGVFGAIGGSNGTYVTEIEPNGVKFGGNIMGSATYPLSYMFGAQPYFFTDEGSGVYSLQLQLDMKVKNGASYPLQGAVSIRVNSDYAMVINNRTWQAHSYLDPSGENEEQFASVSYSEEGQLDVIPVSNFISINDREGGGVTGLDELYNLPIVSTKQGIFRINSIFNFEESAHNIGNIAKHGMISAQGRVFVCWEDGIYGLSMNNLAESDSTPTERLKVSLAIEDTYLLLSRDQKESIESGFDQTKNEIVFTLGDEVWGFNPFNDQWRQIDSAVDMKLLNKDENADLMVFDSTNKTIHTFANKESVKGEIFTQFFNLDDEIAQGIRYIQIRYVNENAGPLTCEIYGDGDMTTPIKSLTTELVQKANPYTLPLTQIKRYANSYAVRIRETANSSDAIEIHKIVVEEDSL